MNKRLQVAKYIIADLFAAILSWTIFFVYRKYINYPSGSLWEVFTDPNYYYGIVFIPVFWVTLYTMIGTYRRIYRKSRLKELGQTLLITLIGVVFIFFALILDDIIINYRSYYQSFLVLLILHFFITYVFRLYLTTKTIHKIHRKVIGFNTLLVGGNANALKIYRDIEKEEISSGNRFVGFVTTDGDRQPPVSEFLACLGHFRDIKQIMAEKGIEEVIIAIEESEQHLMEDIITELEGENVVIKLLPSLRDYLMGFVKTSGIWHAPLVEINPELMPAWQQSMKRIIDIVVAIICMILLLPVYIFVAIGVKVSSRGPVVYSQERIGLHGKPFIMHKFRSMYMEAEKDTPMLSSRDDKRITPFGKFLRKVRLDEIPQFYSVLVGDMSLVGPRPERQYFIDQIVQRAPHYKLLHKVKPGITSWGQVKYGYASNVDEMLERLKYDLLYIENMSLAMDLKIMIYTMLIVVQGRGK
jgi:exopolysaccharide biosynthesis polyprenyl glycosylphosphotransferase